MPQKRAVHACEYCHSHKVRCDVELTRVPCSRCTALGKPCKVRARKKYSARLKAVRTNNSRSDADVYRLTVTPPSCSSEDPTKIIAAAISKPNPRTTPIFIGEGGYGAIIDATVKTSDRHFHMPAAAEKALAVEDLEYLKIKGCFTLPVESKELFEAYFRFVHPSFPVIDGPSVLQQYHDRGLQGINLLLLWSMFSISASYIPSLQRRVCKESYAYRAKLLFDLSQELDKIVLIQSALLLSFWFKDTEDVKQSWYWTSIAFGIAQTLGLHREVRPARSQIAAQQRASWRNIWQCCMIRDVWLAFSMGRPLRINAADCDCSVPEDADMQFAGMAIHDKVLYSPSEAFGVAKMWNCLIATSRILRDIMTTKALSPSQVEFLAVFSSVQDIEKSSPLLTHVHLHLMLHEHAALAALAHANGSVKDRENAAEGTIAVNQYFLSNTSTVFAAPIVIPLVVPAMTTYLEIALSGDLEHKELAEQNIHTCFRFLSAIEDNYPAASIVKGILTTAQEAIIMRGADGRDRDEWHFSSLDQISLAQDLSVLKSLQGDVGF